jgi:hypothetical protein
LQVADLSVNLPSPFKDDLNILESISRRRRLKNRNTIPATEVILMHLRDERIAESFAMQWQINSAFFVSTALQIPLVLVVDIIGASLPKT